MTLKAKPKSIFHVPSNFVLSYCGLFLVLMWVLFNCRYFIPVITILPDIDALR